MTVLGSLEQYASRIANDTYMGVLGRLPEVEEFNQFVNDVVTKGDASVALNKFFKNNYVSIAASLPESTPEDHWKNTVHLYAEHVVRSLYLSLLGREPEPEAVANGLNRLQKQDLTSLIRKMIDSTESVRIWKRKLRDQILEEARSEKEVAYREKNVGVDFELVTYPRLNDGQDLALVFVPYEAWLPFGFAVAQYFSIKYNCKSIFVYQKWSPAIDQAVLLDASVFDVIHWDELKSISAGSKFSPKIIGIHSFGWPTETKYLTSRFPQALLLMYADGFKNAVSPVIHPNPDIAGYGGAIYFSYSIPSTTIPHETTIAVRDVSKYADKIASFYDITPDLIKFENDQGGYAVVYLRYWGIGVYGVDLDLVVASMVNTVCKYIESTTPLIIKDDPRALPILFEQVCIALRAKGYQVESFKDYLVQMGVNAAVHKFPAEYFFSRRLLCGASAHVTFDSSLSYIIATSPEIKRPTRIILGADIRLFDEKSVIEVPDIDAKVKATLISTIKTIKHNSAQYSNVILKSNEVGQVTLLDKESDTLFHIQLS